MVSLIVFIDLPLPLLTRLSSIWSTLLTTTSTSLLYMPKPSKPILNPISSRLTAHPTQHPHLRYTYLILVFALNCPTLCTIQHRRSDRCPIELSFQLKWYFLITQNIWGSSPLQPPSLNTMIYICFYFSIILYYGPKIFKLCNMGMLWSPTFTSKVNLLLLLLKLHSI